MSETWSNLSRVEFTGSGFLTRGEAKKVACRLWVAQLYNGRIIFEIYVDKETNLQQFGVLDWFRRCKNLDFIGTSDDGRRLIVRNITYTDVAGYCAEQGGFGAVTIKHSLYRPGYLEIIRDEDVEISPKEVTYEVTNLPLNRPLVEINLTQAQIKLRQVSRKIPGRLQYNDVTNLMNSLKTAGVLCQIHIDFLQEVSREQVDEFIGCQ